MNFMDLQTLANQYGSDRIVVFTFVPDEQSHSNSLEWTADGAFPQRENLRGLQAHLMPKLREWISEHKAGFVRFGDEVPLEVRAIMLPRKMETMLFASYENDGELTGFVVAANPRLNCCDLSGICHAAEMASEM